MSLAADANACILSPVSKTNLDYSEKMFNKLLWLPSSNNLTKKDVKVISEYINNFKDKE